MAIANVAFEALLAKPIHSQQSAPQQSVSDDPYDILMMELNTPFGYLSTNGDSGLGNTPTAWPSLFPASLDDQSLSLNSIKNSVATTSNPQRSDIAIQTDGLYEPPLSPISAKTTLGSHGSPLSSTSAMDEELDPDWLSFLDEASEVFNEISMPSPTSSGDERVSESTLDSKATQNDRPKWSWAEQLLKPNPTSPTSGYSFPIPGPTMSSIPGSSVGNNSLIRTLHTTPQKSNKSASSAKTSPTKRESKDSEVDGKVVKEEIKSIKIEGKESTKEENADDSLGIIGFFKSLFIGSAK
ncbi:hypothetical protein BGZ76_005021 [Entomortierella beljakovae]|nr:hypothetical protein BGZ76_005021 [Entomortierella beljakovae]